jgi:CPA1 family monovalent cation:H+ antiporter
VGFETVFLVLFAIASAVALAAHRLKLPYTVALVVTGLVLGMIHLIEPPHLTRDLLYSFILPGLLFEASFHLDLGDFWKNRLAIPMLAVPGVLASILLTAGILTSLSRALPFMAGFTFTQGLVFGAVIAATDPIAVTGLFRSLGAPHRLRVLVEGESLLNDGTSLVLFGLVLSYVAGTHVTSGALILQFFKVVGAGALTGIAMGSVVSKIIGSVDDPMIEITLTTIAAYGSFVAAEAIGGSGVIATVAAGMLCGNYAVRSGMSPSTRLAAETFWEYVAFALNSIVFLLIGFEVRVSGVVASWQPILVAYLAVTVGRAFVILGVAGLLRRTREKLLWSWTVVLTWSGLRGALSMVLALGLAAGFAQRSLLVTMTFGVVLLSILVQGTTMGAVLKRTGLVSRSERRLDVDVARGRVLAARAALSEIDRLRWDVATTPGALDAMRQRYQASLRGAEIALGKLHDEANPLGAEENRATLRHLMLTEKSSLLEAAREGLLGREALDKVVAEIDARLVQLDEAPLAEASRSAGSFDE